MADRVCAITRAAQGDRLVQVRLVGPHTDERWPITAPASDAAPSLSPDDAAAWIAERLATGNGADLAAVCVDVEGARCHWLSAPGAASTTLLATMAIGKDGTDWSSRLGSTWAPPTADEHGVQALALDAPPSSSGQRKGRGRAKPEPEAQRLAVVSLPDVQARLLLDALDERGINAPVAMSFWHAMAASWDPAVAPHQGASRTGLVHDRVVGQSAVPCGIVLVDALAGKLLWCWSSQGHVLAAGSLRLDDESAVDDSVLARMANDWIAWSMQLGFGPSSIVCVAPPADPQARTSPALTPGAMQRALIRLWPGASVESVVQDDPVGITLRHVLASHEAQALTTSDPRRSLLALTHRPTRAHRSLYRAGALVLVALSIGLAGIAWRLWQAAGVARGRAEAQDSAIRQAISTVRPIPDDQEVDVFTFERDLQKLRERTSTPKGLSAAKPVLQELDVLSTVIGSVAASNPAVQLEEILLTTVQPRVRLIVPDTATGEEIQEAMGQVAGTNVDWRGEFITGGDPSKRRFEIKGFWKAEVGGPGSTQTGGTP